MIVSDCTLKQPVMSIFHVQLILWILYFNDGTMANNMRYQLDGKIKNRVFNTPSSIHIIPISCHHYHLLMFQYLTTIITHLIQLHAGAAAKPIVGVTRDF